MSYSSDPGNIDDDVAQPALDVGVDSIPDAVVVANRETGRIAKANTAAGELFRCHPTKLVDCHQQQLHPSDHREHYAEAFERAVDGQRVNRLQNDQPLYIEAFDGQKTPVEVNAQRLNTGDGEFILGVFREVTDQLDRERRLEATSTRLETLLDALPIPVAAIDTDGLVERWNQAAETTFGYTAGSVVGKRYPLFIEDDEFEQLFEQVLEGHILESYETTYRAKDGSQVPVELYARPVYENGRLTGVIGASIDLSDQKQQEQQLEVLHRVLRHNLRNELSIINIWTQQLADGGDDSQRAIEQITAASDRLLELSDDAKRIRTALSDDTQGYTAIPITKALDRLSESVTEQEKMISNLDRKPTSGAIPHRGLQAVLQLLDSAENHIHDTALELTVDMNEQYVILEVSASVSILPTGEQSFIHTGRETELEHANDLTVPRACLLVQSVGGSVTLERDTERTPANRLSVELPRIPTRM